MKKSNSKILVIGPSINLIGGVSQCIQTISETKVSQYYDMKFFETSVYVGGSFVFVLMKKLGEIKGYVKSLFTNKPDIIHVHSSAYMSFFEKSLLALIARLLRYKVVFHIHGDDFRQFYLNTGISFLIRNILRCFDRVIFVEEDLPKLTHTKNSVYIPNMVQMASKDIFNSSSSIPQMLTFFSISVIEERKRIDLIVEASRTLLLEGYYFKTVIAGDGPAFNEIKQLIESYRLVDSIQLIGSVDGQEKIDAFVQSDVFILASRSESFGITIAEAMSYGLDIISTPVGIVPSVNHALNTISVFDIDDLKGLTDSMRTYLIHDRDSRRSVNLKNIEYCQNNFSIEAVETLLLSIYTDLVKPD